MVVLKVIVLSIGELASSRAATWAASAARLPPPSGVARPRVSNLGGLLRCSLRGLPLASCTETMASQTPGAISLR